MRGKSDSTHFVMAVAMLTLTGCHTYRPVTIEVVDAESDSPVAHAFVQVWHITMYNFTPPRNEGKFTDDQGVAVLRVAEDYHVAFTVHAPRNRFMRTGPIADGRFHRLADASEVRPDGTIVTTMELSETLSFDGNQARRVGPGHYRFELARAPAPSVRFLLPDDGAERLIVIRGDATHANAANASGEFEVGTNGLVQVDVSSLAVKPRETSFLSRGAEVPVWSGWMSLPPYPQWGVWAMDALLVPERSTRSDAVQFSSNDCDSVRTELYYFGSRERGRELARTLYPNGELLEGKPGRESKYRYTLDCAALERVLAEQAARARE